MPGEQNFLFEFGQDLVHFIVRVATGRIGIHGFAAIAAGSTFLIQVRVLGSTSTFELSVFQ
jgi:hypothetical protein